MRHVDCDIFLYAYAVIISAWSVAEGVLPWLEVIECWDFGANGDELARGVSGQWFPVLGLQIE